MAASIGRTLGCRLVLVFDTSKWSSGAYTEDLNVAAVTEAARMAASVADTSNLVRPEALRAATHPSFYPVQHPWKDVAVTDELPLLRRINERAFGRSDAIQKVRASLAHTTSHVLHVHANGLVSYDERPMARINVQCTAERNGQRETNGY